MGFYLREKDNIRKVKSLEGKYYYLRKSPFGFGQSYTFYDEAEKEIETFWPDPSDCEHVEGFYEDDDRLVAVFEGQRIRAEFSFDEFFT